MRLESLLISVFGQIPWLLVAIFGLALGWRRMPREPGGAFIWLVAGLALLIARCLSVAARETWQLALMADGGFAPISSFWMLTERALLLVAVICLLVSALNGRGRTVPA